MTAFAFLAAALALVPRIRNYSEQAGEARPIATAYGPLVDPGRNGSLGTKSTIRPGHLVLFVPSEAAKPARRGCDGDIDAEAGVLDAEGRVTARGRLGEPVPAS